MSKYKHLIDLTTFTNNTSTVVVSGDIKQYVRLIASDDIELSEHEKTALRAILKSCFENDQPTLLDGGGEIHFIELDKLPSYFKADGLGSSISNIRKTLNQFTKRSIFDKESTKVSLKYGTKSKALYFLKSLLELSSIEKSNEPTFTLSESNKLTRIAKEYIGSELASRVEYDELKSAFMLKQWAILMSTLPLSRGRISSTVDTIRIGKNKMLIKTTVNDEYGGCKEIDARTILHMATIFVQTFKTQIDLGIKPENEIMIDICDLCALAGLEATGANRETIRQSLNRMYHTNYNISLAGSEEEKEQLRSVLDIPDHELNYRFLTELDTSYDRQMRGGRGGARWFRVSVMKSAFESFSEQARKKNVFLWHKEMLRNNNVLLHLIYQRFNVRIMRSNDANIVLRYSEDELHVDIAPSSSLTTFRSYLMKVIRYFFAKKGEDNDDWKPTGEFNIKRLGFDMTFVLSHGLLEEVIVKRDRLDALTGDNSKHRRLRKEKKSLDNQAVDGELVDDNADDQGLMLPDFNQMKLMP